MQRVTFATSDLITYVVNYISSARRALAAECGLNLVQYRALAYLVDHVGGAGSSELARILDVTPAMITVSADDLCTRELLERVDIAGSAERARLFATKRGIDASRDADAVLADAHERYFACLPTRLKAVVDTGSMVTNTPTGEGNRMRDGHFFTAYETLHAFLTVETYLINSTRSEGLAFNGFRILFELGQHDAPLTSRQIGLRLILEPSAVTYAVKELESAGLVTRERNAADRRCVSIALTPAGSEAAEIAARRIESVFTTDIRSSGASERDSYKDAAALVVADLQRHM